MIRHGIAMAIACACFGCESPRLQLYPGEARAPHEVATILEDPEGNVEVTSIDGRKVRGSSFELVPGTYEVVFEARRRVPFDTPNSGKNISLKTTCTLSFEAHAGEVYIARSENSVPSEGGGWGGLDAWLELQSKRGSRVGSPECSRTMVVVGGV